MIDMIRECGDCCAMIECVIDIVRECRYHDCDACFNLDMSEWLRWDDCICDDWFDVLILMWMMDWYD
jgi:hypothetical protein